MGRFTETCGAISGGCAIIGYATSDGHFFHFPTTTVGRYRRRSWPSRIRLSIAPLA
ncbi:MAG: C_GCAxxG_C_C family protein [Eggerthellaceae bacterium]|nr:C_GCAxxG_C_C family protein [Eggerthellaceae bacterium]MBR0404650.1 C_GCAxxG_C_C family protein [Eggerthellaceae bacterium]